MWTKSPDPLTAVLARRLPAEGDVADGGVAHATAIATIVRITSGNFRLDNRLLTQIERVQTTNDLGELAPEVVEAARQALLIGH